MEATIVCVSQNKNDPRGYGKPCDPSGCAPIDECGPHK